MSQQGLGPSWTAYSGVTAALQKNAMKAGIDFALLLTRTQEVRGAKKVTVYFAGPKLKEVNLK